MKQLSFWPNNEPPIKRARKRTNALRHFVGSEMPVHWFSVLRDLIYAGRSLRNIARQVHMSRSQVARLYNEGTEPKFEAGERLLRLWMVVTGKSEEEIPRMSKYDWRR